MPNTITELVAEPCLKVKASLGEGPTWNSPQQKLHWVDINRSEIHTFDPATGSDTTINVGEPVGCVVNRHTSKGSELVAGIGGKIVLVGEGGQLETLCSLSESANNRVNDGKVDPAGRFWFGTLAYGFAPGAGNMYMLDGDRTLHTKLERVTISNGMTWSLNKKKMFYIDTGVNAVEVFDYDVEAGAIEGRRFLVRNGWLGHFDGMTMDADENLYVAIWGGGCVMKFDSRTGSLLAKIVVPGVKNVTSCTFGGPDLKRLFITTSGEGADAKEEPNAGNMFSISFDDCHGLNAFEYQG